MNILLVLVIFSAAVLPSIKGRRLGRQFDGDENDPRCSNSYYSEKWTSTGEVPGKLAQVPPAPLYMRYSGKRVFPNDMVTTEDMYARPTMKWDFEQGALYTIMLIDFGIERLMGQQYFHWLVANEPNWNSINSGQGDEVMRNFLPV